MAMKNVLCVCVLVATVLTLTAGQDVGQLLRNDELVKREIGCVLNRNKCDVIGKQIKTMLPEALHHGCKRCTPQQAQNARKLMGFMKAQHPDEWRQILQLYAKPKRAASFF